MTGENKARLSPLVPYILAGCTAVSVLSTDLLTPSIPSLPSAFGTDIRVAQLTVGVNLAAYSLAQLFHGPLADRFGRRRLLLWAFAIFAVISVGCAFATSVEMLLVGRFLQGLFSSVPAVVIILIIRELYGSQDGVRVMALYGAALGMAPAVGPLIGGYLQVWFGWSAGFWVIALLAILTLTAFWRWVPESLPEPLPTRFQNPLGTYLRLLRDPVFLRLALALALTFGAYFAYVTTAPVIFIDKFGLPEQHYGLTYLVVIMAFIIGNVLSARLARIWDGDTIVRNAMRLKLVAMAIMLIPAALGYETIPLILLSMAVYAVGFAAMMAAGPIVLLDKVPDLPQGPASAVLGSLQLGAAALAGAISSISYNGSALTMALTMAGFVTLGALLLRSVRRLSAVGPGLRGSARVG